MLITCKLLACTWTRYVFGASSSTFGTTIAQQDLPRDKKHAYLCNKTCTSTYCTTTQHGTSGPKHVKTYASQVVQIKWSKSTHARSFFSLFATQFHLFLRFRTQQLELARQHLVQQVHNNTLIGGDLGPHMSKIRVNYY